MIDLYFSPTPNGLQRSRDLNDLPHRQRWFDTVATRPATLRTYDGVENVYAPRQQAISEEERRVLFGQGGRQ
jgi:GSH-dependent disulfide-bond oxidoreductase